MCLFLLDINWFKIELAFVYKWNKYVRKLMFAEISLL